ncbi:hypothetical protein ACNR9V_19055 [Parageobacillus thermoglucosidasius]|uniref:hypothetical protein n=1 Tax=Parageobacillus thermoglucosidasius TaxID=1426 RepID=UPI003B66C0CF
MEEIRNTLALRDNTKNSNTNRQIMLVNNLNFRVNLPAAVGKHKPQLVLPSFVSSASTLFLLYTGNATASAIIIHFRLEMAEQLF